MAIEIVPKSWIEKQEAARVVQRRLLQSKKVDVKGRRRKVLVIRLGRAS